jgi:hypothetical protein
MPLLNPSVDFEFDLSECLKVRQRGGGLVAPSGDGLTMENADAITMENADPITTE